MKRNGGPGRLLFDGASKSGLGGLLGSIVHSSSSLAESAEEAEGWKSEAVFQARVLRGRGAKNDGGRVAKVKMCRQVAKEKCARVFEGGVANKYEGTHNAVS